MSQKLEKFEEWWKSSVISLGTTQHSSQKAAARLGYEQGFIDGRCSIINESTTDLSTMTSNQLVEELISRFDGVLVVMTKNTGGDAGWSHAVNFGGGTCMGSGLAKYATEYFVDVWKNSPSVDIDKLDI